MYAGAGFDAGASQFAGGGFMPSQGAQAQAGGSAQKKNFDNKNQTLRAVTVKQLHQACSGSMDDTLILDGTELTNLCIVARIVSVEEQNVTCNLWLDDGTGKIKTQHYIDAGEDEATKARRAEWTVGTYVRVHGTMRSLNKERSLLAFHVHPVSDYNEVTYHALQAVFQHAHLTKGGANAPATNVAYAGAAPAYNAGAPPAYNTAAAAAPAAGGYNAGDDQMTPIQREVLAVIHAARADGSLAGSGINAGQVAGACGGRIAVAQVQQAMVGLADQGHLYNSVDDQHFLPC